MNESANTILEAPLSLYHLLDPEVLADPYPLYHRFLEEAPVHWDSFLHAWVVTRYTDVLWILHNCSAQCAPDPRQIAAMGVADMSPIADVMVRMMLFMDPPTHSRLRSLAAPAFSAMRAEPLRGHIQEIVDRLLNPLLRAGGMEVLEDFAGPLSTIVTAEMLGVPSSDHRQLKAWSADFAEVLGNFQHNPDQIPRMLRTLGDMQKYFMEAIRDHRRNPRDAVIDSLLAAEINGERLSDDAVVANCILIMVGGQETTPNLIGNGMLTLLRNPEELDRLRKDLLLVPSAVEELLRYESPSQHTTRIATHDVELSGKNIRKGETMIVVMGAANRDPERFPDPDRVDLSRADNKHLAFGGGAHFCFGAPLARVEGQVAFDTIMRRTPHLRLDPQVLQWRPNLGLRGLESLTISF
jgi:pimeloyl-[acyl-carrier protein] synthase